MKIAITLTLDVDPDVWDAEYGTGTDAGAVREDVREYVLNTLQGVAASESGAIRSTTLR